MISSHCLPWFFILYGNFEYRIVAGLQFQLKTNNQNAGSWLCNIRRGLPTPQKDCHSGKMKLTYTAVLTKNLPKQGTLSINLFWTTKYCYRKQSGKKADGERLTLRQDKWNCLKKCDDKTEGKEPRHLPYTFLPVTLGRTRLMGLIWGKALTTMLAILFFWVVEEGKGKMSLS